jgi:Domain of unknown function (DUF4342)
MTESTAPGRAIIMTTTTDENVRTEEHMVAGDRLVERIKELVRQGNIRRIHVKNMEGRTLLEIPLTIGVVGAVLMPVCPERSEGPGCIGYVPDAPRSFAPLRTTEGYGALTGVIGVVRSSTIMASTACRSAKRSGQKPRR